MLSRVGLAVGYRANVWNIGAEGQFIARRDLRRRRRAVLHDARDRSTAVGVTPMVLVAGVARRHGVGGDHRAAARPLQRERDPGEPDARVRRAAAAQLSRVRPVEGPEGFNFPQTKMFVAATLLPNLVPAVAPARRLRDHARAGGGCSGRSCSAPGAASSSRSAGSRPTRRATPGSRRGPRCGPRS